MNRRNFLQGIAALVGGIAIEKAIPFGRVWSFPSRIVIPKRCECAVKPCGCLTPEALKTFSDSVEIASGLKSNVRYQVFSSDWKLRGTFEAPPLLSSPEAINWASSRNMIKPTPQTGNIIVFDDTSQRLSPMFSHELRARDGNTFLNLTRS